MQMVSANCPACGGVYGGRVTSRFITCEYCGSRFALSENELRAFGFTDADGDGYDDNDTAKVSKTKKAQNQSISNDPVYAFARKECEEFLEEGDIDQSDFVSSNKIVNGLSIKNNDDVYLIHDDTLFKSGKNGFAITQSGIYCREFGDGSSHFVSWEKFAREKEPRVDDSYVRQGGTSICYFTGDDDVRDQLCDMLVRIWRHAKTVS